MQTVTIEIFYFEISNHETAQERLDAFMKTTRMVVDPFFTDDDFPCAVDGINGLDSYDACLLELPEGSSKGDAHERIASIDNIRPWMAAEAEHMLAFGTEHRLEQMEDCHFVFGLGRKKETMLASIDSVRGTDPNRFFMPIPAELQEYPVFGGKSMKFLAVRKH
jgi:hypothetical protein